MAILQDYQDVAPTVMSVGSFTLTAIETKLASVPTEPTSVEPSAPTKAKVIALFNDVFAYATLKEAFEKVGGYGALAKKHELTKEQVKTLIKEMQAMHQVYLEPEEE